MKEFDELPTPDKTTEVREVKKQTLLGQMVVQRGLTLFEYDPETKILEEANFSSVITEGMHLKKHKRQTHKILERKKGCIYFQALNRRNAIKKLQRIGN